MATYSDGIHSCGSCALWGGQREINGHLFPAAFVRIDNDERGKCMGGGFSGVEMRAIQSCSKWFLWPALRKNS